LIPLPKSGPILMQSGAIDQCPGRPPPRAMQDTPGPQILSAKIAL
jgi:hypothetical protein